MLFRSPMDYKACQAPLFMEFSRQEYWSGLLFPSPGDLPDPGIESGSLALQADSLPSEPPGKSHALSLEHTPVLNRKETIYLTVVFLIGKITDDFFFLMFLYLTHFYHGHIF